MLPCACCQPELACRRTPLLAGCGSSTTTGEPHHLHGQTWTRLLSTLGSSDHSVRIPRCGKSRSNCSPPRRLSIAVADDPRPIADAIHIRYRDSLESRDVTVVACGIGDRCCTERSKRDVGTGKLRSKQLTVESVSRKVGAVPTTPHPVGSSHSIARVSAGWHRVLPQGDRDGCRIPLRRLQRDLP